MSSRKIIYILAIMGGVFNSALMAQTPTKLDWSQFDDTKIVSGWLQSENAAGLTRCETQRISNIAIYGSIDRGDLKNYYSSDKEYCFGLKAASYYRVSKRTVLYGEVGYHNLTRLGATGSYFIDPLQTPFDLMEFTEEHAGRKKLEQFHVLGSVGAELTDWLSVGATFDYNTANYAKRKDLRHTNSLMDMTFSPALRFRVSENLSFGLNYTYRRRNESLLLSLYGKTDQNYYSLLSYGAFFGKREFFGDQGYTSKSESKPLFDKYHGGGIQASWRISPRVEWFNEVSYRIRDGYYGDPSPSTIVYAEHDGSEFAYKTLLTNNGDRNIHIWRIEFVRREVNNFENVYRYQSEETGKNYIEYLDKIEVGKRTERQINFGYVGQIALRDGIPVWRVAIDGSFDSREIKASNYPDYRKQNIAWWHIDLSGERNLLYNKNCFTIGLRGGYAFGTGDSWQDGKYESSNESETLTRTNNDLLMQEYEFLTAPQLNITPKIRYTRQLGQKNIRGYIELDYAWSMAFSAESLGDAMRHVVRLSVGCNF